MKKEDILRKICSRKFWLALAGVISSILVACNVGDNQIAQVTAIITAFGSIVVYIFAESSADVASINANTTETVITTSTAKTTATNLSKDLNAEKETK
jgi:hypothetical protein